MKMMTLHKTHTIHKDFASYFHKKSAILLLLLFVIFSPLQATAVALGENLQKSEFYFLIDADTKEILLSKNADVRIAPSSMTKLMTAYVVFDQIAKGRISFDNQCLIGKDAWRKYGSSMFLNYGDVVSIEDLIKGLLVVSGNDAAIALAETTAGGLENFIDLMNLKARELGLKNSHFRNPHGLNEEGHYMSLRDLATLTVHLYKDFPQYSHFFGLPDFTYRSITQRNRNPLIKENYEGTVGGKTGHTNEGGYGIVGVVKRDHRRLIAIVNKAKTAKQRAEIITELLDYGFEKYKKLVLFEKGQTVANIKTWLGRKSELSVSTNQEIALNIPRDKPIDSIKVKVKYLAPVYSPVVKGSKVATLVVEVAGYKNFEYSLFANETIEKVGYLRRVKQIMQYKISSLFSY